MYSYVILGALWSADHPNAPCDHPIWQNFISIFAGEKAQQNRRLGARELRWYDLTPLEPVISSTCAGAKKEGQDGTNGDGNSNEPKKENEEKVEENNENNEADAAKGHENNSDAKETEAKEEEKEAKEEKQEVKEEEAKVKEEEKACYNKDFSRFSTDAELHGILVAGAKRRS